jgi:uncharacterized protein YbcC (UPF0753/DUF2309 family)
VTTTEPQDLKDAQDDRATLTASPSGVAEPGAALDLGPAIEAALAVLPPAPPLTELAAVNPLAGLDHLPFGDAAREAARLFGADAYLPLAAYRQAWHEGRITRRDLLEALAATGRPAADLEGLVADLDAAADDHGPSRSPMTPAEWSDAQAGTAVRAEIDRRAGQWVGLALGLTAATAQAPVLRHGLYAAWWSAAVRDRSLPRQARQRLQLLKGEPMVALQEALVRLGVAPGQSAEVVLGEVTAQPGWAARLAWEAGHGRYPRTPAQAITELVALRLGLTMALLPAGGSPRPVTAATPPTTDPRPIWQEALEAGPRRELLAALPAPPGGPEPRDGRAPAPAAQIACCIDVRSEALRRHLEAIGDYETLGVAGFFGLPMAWRRLDGEAADASCPLVVSPAIEVGEAPRSAEAGTVVRARRGRTSGASGAGRRAAKGVASPYLFAEAAGWVAGPVAAARTFAPALAGRSLARWGSTLADDLAVDLPSLSVDERAELAAGVLQAIGLTRRFAPLVVLCGHGSTTAANPYEAALRCGACGGRDGTDNARTLVALLSDAEVRVALAGRGIAIPEGTTFVAARHDTTTDEVALVGAVPDVPGVEQLAADLAAAGDAVAAERSGALPGAAAGSTRAARRRAWDWAEPTPEWGLAGNMAFVIADRSLTRSLTLGRRAFLHSYDRAADTDGSILAGILAGPALVTQWINAAYHFSVTAPEAFGSGSKALHNPVGVAGVLSGPGGDLRLGLPVQSVAAEGLVHEPLRPMCVIDAPPVRVTAALEGAPRTRTLVANGWMALVARDDDGRWVRWTDAGWAPTLPEDDDGQAR